MSEVRQYNNRTYRLLRGLRQNSADLKEVSDEIEPKVPKKRKCIIKPLKDGHHVITHCIMRGEINYEKFIGHEVQFLDDVSSELPETSEEDTPTDDGYAIEDTTIRSNESRQNTKEIATEPDGLEDTVKEYFDMIIEEVIDKTCGAVDVRVVQIADACDDGMGAGLNESVRKKNDGLLFLQKEESTQKINSDVVAKVISIKAADVGEGDQTKATNRALQILNRKLAMDTYLESDSFVAEVGKVVDRLLETMLVKMGSTPMAEDTKGMKMIDVLDRIAASTDACDREKHGTQRSKYYRVSEAKDVKTLHSYDGDYGYTIDNNDDLKQYVIDMNKDDLNDSNQFPAEKFCSQPISSDKAYIKSAADFNRGKPRTVHDEFQKETSKIMNACAESETLENEVTECTERLFETLITSVCANPNGKYEKDVKMPNSVVECVDREESHAINTSNKDNTDNNPSPGEHRRTLETEDTRAYVTDNIAVPRCGGGFADPGEAEKDTINDVAGETNDEDEDDFIFGLIGVYVRGQQSFDLLI